MAKERQSDKVVADESLSSAADVKDYMSIRDSMASGVEIVPDSEDEDEKTDDEKTDDEKTTTGAESKKKGTQTDKSDDGNEETGETSEKKKSEQLSKGVRRRLERAKRQTERERGYNAELQQRIKTLEDQAAKSSETKEEELPEKPEAKSTEQKLDPDKPIAEADYDFDYPEESDYLEGADDQEAAAKVFLEDVRRWEKNLPLQGGKYSEAKEKSKADDTKAETKKREDQKPKDSQREQRQREKESAERVEFLFQDLQDAIEDGSESKTLFDDFQDQFEDRKFRLSFAMLEWMADNDDAALVAEAIVKSNRVANRIFRKNASEHKKLLTDLAERLKKGSDTKGEKSEEEKLSETGKNIAKITPLRGRRTSVTSDPVKAKNFEDYESARLQRDKAKRARSG